MKLLDQLGLQYLIEKFKEGFDLKQDKLTAGDNITITNNTISATDTVYDDTSIQTELGKKADKTYVDSQDALKADKTYVDSLVGDINSVLQEVIDGE